jgi:hypothetical protein
MFLSLGLVRFYAESGLRWPEVAMSAEDLRDLAAKLRDRLPGAVEAAARVCAVLRRGGRPETGDVDLILRAMTDFDGARIRFVEIRPEDPVPETFEMFSQALEAVAAEASRSERLHRLAGIQGPAALEPILEQVRQAVRTGEPQGLELLAELIDLAADTDDFQELDDTAELARARLPDRWRPLINAALNRRLDIDGPGQRQAELGSLAEGRPAPAVPGGERGQAGGQGPVTPPGGVRARVMATPSNKEGDEEGDETASYPPRGARDDGAEVAREPIAWPGRPAGVSAEPLGAPPGFGLVMEEPESVCETEAPETKGRHEAGSGAGTAYGRREPGFAEAEAAALRSARFGLAAWLREAAGRPMAETQARRCAGIAREMSDFAGQLSAEFSETAEGLNTQSLADDPAGALLAWAAAIRAGIVHPTPASIRLLKDLVPVVSRYPGLSAYGEAFATAADSGVYLVPNGSGDARGVHPGRGRQRAVRASARLLEEGPYRRLSPALVEETWRVLVQQDAVLGRLLGAAARDDAVRVDEVADQMAALRAAGALGQLIDETVRQVAGGPAESTTVVWLGEMINDALREVARWVAAVKGTASVGAERITEALAELRGSIERNEVLAAVELSGPVAAGGPVVAAAAEAARLLIRETLELLDGAPRTATEPPFAHIVNRELLLAPAVRIHPATLAPYQPPTLADVIAVSLAAEEDWEGAFEARAERGDHEGTRAIIAVLERREPGRVLPLRLRREELVRAARAARDERVAATRVRVARGVRDGALTEEAAARIEGTLQDLTGPLRDDFGRVLSVLDELETDIARGTSHNLKLFGGTAGPSASHP